MSDVNTELIQGNCIDVMGSMEPESVHAIVTDPPYGLAFMGNSWDDFEPKEYQEWCEEWATEALRVLKPGGHMLAFSGSRTFHRLFVGVEDAGFEVRDTIMWMYGSGFPTGSDISNSMEDEGDIERWAGWNTQLKPAFEPVVLARKSLEEDTVSGNVLEYGTGAINLDECRIEAEEGDLVPTERGGFENTYEASKTDWGEGDEYEPHEEGRHPANVAIDLEAAEMLNRDSGEVGGGSFRRNEESDVSNAHEGYQRPGRSAYTHNLEGAVRNYGDSGGASRFFYTSKAKTNEKTVGGRVENPHPTVKPIDLMEWMVKMVSAEEQTILDPFAGTGTTLMAAYNVGRNAIGIEKDSDYMETAKERVRANEEHIDEVGTEPDHVYNEATGW